MNILCLLALLALSTGSMLADSSTRIKFHELPSKSTGIGSSDCYWLGASVGELQPRFFLTLLAVGNIDMYRVMAKSDRDELPIKAKSTRKEAGKESFLISIELSKKQIEKADTSGIAVSIVSGGVEKYTLTIPSNELEELIQLATDHDKDFRESKQLTKEKRNIIESITKDFSSSEFSWAFSIGTGKIYGQTFSKTQSGDVKFGAANTILLYPATDKISLVMESLYLYPDLLDYLPHNIYEEIKKAMRTTTADASGNFEFPVLPKGVYQMVTCHTWKVPGRYGIEDTGGLIRKTITLRDGEASKVMLTP